MASPRARATPQAGELRPHPLAWLPNVLTTMRMALAPALLFLLIQNWWSQHDTLLGAAYGPGLAAGGGVLLIAGLLDYWDGRLARQWDAQSAFGEFWDPVADKLVIGAALIGAALAVPALWLAAAAIITRDVGVTVLRTRADGGAVRSPSRLAKAKTVAEFAGLAAVLLWSLPVRAFTQFSWEPPVLAVEAAAWLLDTGIVAVYAAAAIALWTGGQYAWIFWRARRG